ncbi:MAG: helix-turn-helix transcriptional regulator, partial [Firmicutes bacterium]|nr:helix-turn-helix transcriptional regulator [Alicyclobacillaceae bacterium]MCL6498133.1 helix-turn-helix transcriptional regulator [Bacillota bacterium]
MPHVARDPVVGLVLAVLEAGPAHGYQISRRIVEWSGATLRVGEGTLYPVLHALEAQGWVTATVESHGDR